MKERHPHIKKVLVEEGADGYTTAVKALKSLKGVPLERVKSHQTPAKTDPLNLHKETLRLLPFQGQFLKPCPGTKAYICCGYQILQVGTNCPLDCSYCILQAYFNQPSLRIFVNLEDKLEHMGQLMDSHPEKTFRIGTGEFTDSLALDPILGWSDILLPFVSKRKNAVLELKTKTDQIKGLLSSSYRDRTIVSWSLNSPYIASREDRKAPEIKKRLKAARRCQKEYDPAP
jgi:spore photoproduct lyase